MLDPSDMETSGPVSVLWVLQAGSCSSGGLNITKYQPSGPPALI